MTLIFQAKAERWDVREHIVPGKINKWYIRRYIGYARLGSIALLWSAKGSLGNEVQGFHGWGIVSGRVEEKSNVNRVPITYIEKWTIDSGNALFPGNNTWGLSGWDSHLLKLTPAGTTFLVTPEQLDVLAKYVEELLPDSSFPKAVQSGEPLEPNDWVGKK